MKRCSSDCYAICDFCKYYAFNGEPHSGTDGKVAMVYVGKGECMHADHPSARDPHEMCVDFHCQKLEKQEREQAQKSDAMQAVTDELTSLWVDGEANVCP